MGWSMMIKIPKDQSLQDDRFHFLPFFSLLSYTITEQSQSFVLNYLDFHRKSWKEIIEMAKKEKNCLVNMKNRIRLVRIKVRILCCLWWWWWWWWWAQGPAKNWIRCITAGGENLGITQVDIGFFPASTYLMQVIKSFMLMIMMMTVKVEPSSSFLFSCFAFGLHVYTDESVMIIMIMCHGLTWSFSLQVSLKRGERRGFSSLSS